MATTRCAHPCRYRSVQLAEETGIPAKQEENEVNDGALAADPVNQRERDRAGKR